MLAGATDLHVLGDRVQPNANCPPLSFGGQDMCFQGAGLHPAARQILIALQGVYHIDKRYVK